MSRQTCPCGATFERTRGDLHDVVAEKRWQKTHADHPQVGRHPQAGRRGDRGDSSSKGDVMTGPEHYKKAIHLVCVVARDERTAAADEPRMAELHRWLSEQAVEMAMVHATLALAAATAEAGGLDHQPEWRDIVLPEDQQGEPS